jgi:hypothetical protein
MPNRNLTAYPTPGESPLQVGPDPDESHAPLVRSSAAPGTPTSVLFLTIHSVARMDTMDPPRPLSPSALHEREPQLGWQIKNRLSRIQALTKRVTNLD